MVFVDLCARALVLACVFMMIQACPEKCKCLGNDVHCASQGLQNFPSNLPKGTIQLLIQNNSITSLPTPYVNETQLHTIALQNNKISYLQPCSFCGVSDLNYLDLSNNTLKSISSGALTGLQRLSLLNLAKNAIKRISIGAFSDLRSLRELFLSDNLLATLPPKIFSTLSNLNTLRLEHNNLQSIPDGSFRALTFLRVLDLSHNRLQRITPGTTGGLSGVQELLLQNNMIRNFDSHFLQTEKTCSELKDEAKRSVSSVGGCFSNLRELQTINLSNNLLSSVTFSSFSSLSRLTRLFLNNNKWRCNCFLIRSLMRLRDHGNRRLAFGQMSCWEPEELRGVSTEDLTDPSELSQFPQYFDDQTISFLTTESPKAVTKSLTSIKNQIIRKFPTRIPSGAETGRGGEDNSVKAQFSPVHATQGEVSTTQKSPSLIQGDLHLRTTLVSPSNAATNSSEVVGEAPQRSPMLKEFPGLTQTLFDDDVGSDVSNRVNETSNMKIKRDQGDDNIYIKDFNLKNDETIHKSFSVQNQVTKPQNYAESKTRKFPILLEERNSNMNHQSTRGNDIVSWLLVVAIFAAVFTVAICGAIALNRQFNTNGKHCGCCSSDEEKNRQNHSESMRSVSNYPLLYDNPLARRPLPKQPMQLDREGIKVRQPLRATRSNDNVDVQWTNGGTFGIGGNGQTRFSGIYRRSMFDGKIDLPPDIPPRDPINVRHWTENDDGIVYPPGQLTDTSSQNVRSSHYKKCRESRNSTANSSYIRSNSSRSDDFLRINSQNQAGHRKKRSHHRNKKHRHGKVFRTENSSKHDSIDLIPADINALNEKYQSASAPVTRQNSETANANARFSKRSSRKCIVDQMLEALDEIENIKQNRNATKGRKSREHMNNRGSVNSPTPKKKYIVSSMAPRNSGHISSRRQKNDLSLCKDEEFSVELYHRQKKLKTPRTREMSSQQTNNFSIQFNKRPVENIDKNQTMNNIQRSSNISDIDFEFPPPPPCATMSCNEDSQSNSSSLSQASYNFELPPPPPPVINCHSSNYSPSYETPVTTHYVMESDENEEKKKENQETEEQQELEEEEVEEEDQLSDTNYSTLAQCSSRQPISAKSKAGYLIRESDYKSGNRPKKAKDWFWTRKESIDSMFVSVDSTCESPLLSDEDNYFPDDENCVDESSNYRPKVKYRNPCNELRKDRLFLPDTQRVFRNSMPVFNNLKCGNLELNLARTQYHMLQGNRGRVTGSERCLYKSVGSKNGQDADLLFGSGNRLSRLELSCSESEESDDQSPKDHSHENTKINFCRRTSSSESTDTVTQISQPNTPRSGFNARSYQRTRNVSGRSDHQPVVTVSSHGTESVSSIEFEITLTEPNDKKDYTYHELAQMYSGKLPSSHEQVLFSASRNKTNLRSKPKQSNNVKTYTTVSGNRNLTSPSFQKVDKTRCYLDVMESSADDVSTDVELFDLTTV